MGEKGPIVCRRGPGQGKRLARCILAPGALNFQAVQPTTVVKPARKKSRSSRRSIVIVDDERSYVELMSQMIAENLDCKVHAFTNPVDALENLPAISAGVVVTDYSMPQMDGIEFIRKASKVAPKSAFIMISGHDLDTMKEDLDTLKTLKLRLQKPFGWRPLTEAVLKVWPGDDSPILKDEG
jgi:DNA-binding NtrC family response regulator